MKLSFTLTLLAGLATALPTIELPSAASIEARQNSNSRTDLENGGACPPVVFIYARGTAEGGNLGAFGGLVGSGLETQLGRGKVWVQGVGGRYTASVVDNTLPDGTSAVAIAEMTRLFQLADKTCPGATIVAGGYSQGAALTAAAIRDLNPTIRGKIAGVVLFGYTKNRQNNGRIPNYPSDDVKVFCNPGDLVCSGMLFITMSHLTYQNDARGAAPQFLVSKINGA